MKKPNQKNAKPSATLVGVLLPPELIAALDAEAKARDLDRSKVIRRALRQVLRSA